MPGRESASALEHAASSSQADTEPLPFDEDAEPVVHQVPDATMASAYDDAQHTSQDDTSMDDVDAAAALTSVGQEQFTDSAAPFSDALTGLEDDEDAQGEEDAMGSDEEEDDDDEDDDAPTATADGSANLDGGEETGPTRSSAAGAGFSDGSELTDESDEEDAEGEGEEDEEEEDDDEMGGGSDDDDDEEEEDEDEDAEGEDEDEAAKGLAALTGGRLDGDEDGESGGLDGLAVLAAVGAGDADDRLNEDSDSESVKSAVPVTRTRASKGRFTAKPRLGSRLNEVMIASEQTSGAEEDDDDLANENGEDGEGSVAEEEESRTVSKARSREMSSLGQFASAAKRTAARAGPAAGLLAGAPAITIEEGASGAASLATTPAGSPKAEDDDGLDADLEKVEGGKKDEEEDEEGKEIGLETPVQELEEAVPDDEQSTDEAALKRQEAMDALTKIEIGFAVLRDKLYVERMEEISKEGEMIMEGSHPDLIYLTNFIEARRERRLKLVDLWFAQQQKQYERVAHVEEAAAWNNWRNEVVQLRQEQLDDVSRKRRKLDREKRSLDGPRPARRHQIFETELMRNPDYDNAARTANDADGGHKGKRDIDPRQQELEDLDEMGAYVAYPDLRSADEQEAWMDMERMGIQPDVRLLPGANFYRMEEMAMDGYPGPYDQPQLRAREAAGGFNGGHAVNGGMEERYVERNVDMGDRHGRGQGGFIDGYDGPAGAPSRFGGPMHLEQPGRHMMEGVPHSRNAEPIYMDDAHVHDMPPRSRNFSPGPDPRHAMDERMFGEPPKKPRGPMGMPRSPPPPPHPMHKAPGGGGAARKSMPGQGGGGGQRGMYGMDGRPPHHDEGAFYEPPPPHMHPSPYGPPPPGPPSSKGPPPNGAYPSGPGPILDSPQQHHLHPHPAAPPPPRMAHPMQHNGPIMPPADYPSGRRAEPVYPH